LLMQRQLANMPSNTMKYFILDEVTDIQHWDKTIKYLADLGAFENTVLVLSGSDLILMQDARKRFPGRRGRASQVDFHYYPLSFREYFALIQQLPDPLDSELVNSNSFMKLLYREFDHYLIHGGFLTAINDFAKHQTIADSTLAIYSDWIRGDMLKRNKSENFLYDIIGAIIKHYTKQVSWDNLVKELSINHTQTVADYIHALESMDAVFSQAAIIEDKLRPAPKKRKKLMFNDPFIYHAMKAWLHPAENQFNEQIKKVFEDPQCYAELVEACVTTHFRRFFPTYYIKAEGEVDIAYVHQDRFWPIEVKWRNQLRPQEFKQLAKYKNAEIFAKIMVCTSLENIPVKPLPWALLHVDQLRS
jgi:uncharacterized protein